jgi:hypothetical protein
MSHQCPFPVRSTDTRCSNRAGSAPSHTLTQALIAALACFSGFSHAQVGLSSPDNAAHLDGRDPAASSSVGSTSQSIQQGTRLDDA